MVSRLLLIAACADGAMQNAFSVAIDGLPKPLFVNVAASLETHKADFIRGRGPDPFGLLCWPAAQVVCEALVERARGLQADSSMDLSHSLSGTRVLEVGAGTGLCSLAAASLGVQVTATDAHPEPLAQLEAAAAAQDLDVETYCWRLEQPWPTEPAFERGPSMLLIAADVLYTEELADALAARCADVCVQGGSALVADSIGLYRERFEEQLLLAAPNLSPPKRLQRSVRDWRGTQGMLRGSESSSQEAKPFDADVVLLDMSPPS